MSSNDEKTHFPVVLRRNETALFDTTKPFEQVAFRPRQHTSSAGLGAVIGAKFARMVEVETTKQLAEIEKQSASIRSITDNLTAAYKMRVETAVVVEQFMVDWLDAHHRVLRIREQIRIDELLHPQQLQLQAKHLERALIDAEAEIDAANAKRMNAANTEAHRYRLSHNLDRRRLERKDEADEADHQVHLAESVGKRTKLSPLPLPPPPPDTSASRGDQQEAQNVAEDVADGYVPTDAAHLYHAFGALAWISCIRRGMTREQALHEVTAKVFDRQQRHPLTQRDAWAYNERYVGSVQEFEAEQTAKAQREAAQSKAKAQEREREVRIFEAKAQKEAELGKAAMERDAALARERTARTFMSGDGYDPMDDSDVVS